MLLKFIPGDLDSIVFLNQIVVKNNKEYKVKKSIPPDEYLHALKGNFHWSEQEEVFEGKRQSNTFEVSLMPLHACIEMSI